MEDIVIIIFLVNSSMKSKINNFAPENLKEYNLRKSEWRPKPVLEISQRNRAKRMRFGE